MKITFPFVMKSTAIITAVLTAALAVLHHAFGIAWLRAAAISCGTTCYHFTMRLLVGAIVPRFAKHADPRHVWFRQRSFESALYNRLNVKSWKGRLPTYDPGQFSTKDNSLRQIVLNTCGAELVHEVIILFSFVPLLFSLQFGDFFVFLITSVFAAVFDSIFVIAQRYNRPRLMRILQKEEAARNE